MMNTEKIPVEQVMASFSRPYPWGKYDRYRETKKTMRDAWLRHRTAESGGIQSLMDRLGYRKKNKLLRRITRDWLTLKKPVPLAFLRGIGLSFRTLCHSLANDRTAYRSALRRRTCPACIACRIIPGFSLTLSLPADTPKETAIEEARRLLVRYRKTGPRDYALVIYPGLKEIRVTRKDSVLLTHTPRIIHSGDRLCFLTGGPG